LIPAAFATLTGCIQSHPPSERTSSDASEVRVTMESLTVAIPVAPSLGQLPPGAARAADAARPLHPAATAPAAAAPTAKLVFSRRPCSAAPTHIEQEFSVTGVRELFACAIYSGLVGEHTQLMRFYAPNGEVFYQKVVAFSTVASAPVPFMPQIELPHDGFVRPVALDEQGQVAVGDYLALAGAWIGDRGMVGPWQLEIFLDHGTEPIASAGFELVP
jgi:hypothetical protein